MAFLACDWGGTNLRAWRIGDDGAVQDRRDFPFGVTQLQPREASGRFHRDVRPALGAQSLPAILCGMIGSDLGWGPVPYLACPANLAGLAANLSEVDAGVFVVPGVRGPGIAAAPDIIRGEETQFLGWLSADPARVRGRRVICHPGTHAKWAVIEDGRLVRFVTFMTGELFAVLTRHSILRTDASAQDDDAFDEGLAAAGNGGALAARLFSARSRVVAAGAPGRTTGAYLSGLLIGAEVAQGPELCGLAAGEPVILLGDSELCRRYGRALARAGRPSETFDGDEAVLAGLTAIWRAAAVR